MIRSTQQAMISMDNNLVLKGPAVSHSDLFVGAECNEKDLICVYEKHVANRFTIENYNMFMNDIIDDILMGKISTVQNKIILRGVNKKAVDTIKLFYELTETLAKLFPVEHTNPREYYRVYRRMNFEFTNCSLIQPIPFSTCISYDYIRNQGLYMGEIQYIYIIDFSKNTRFVSVYNENEGKEIILPACTLRKSKTLIELDGTTIYNCIVVNETESYPGMKDLINSSNSILGNIKL